MSPATARDETPLDVQLHAFVELGEACDDVSRLVADSFAQTLRRIVLRIRGDGPEADQALADGALVIQGHTVVLRLNPQTDFVELFCDIGQPAVPSLVPRRPGGQSVSAVSRGHAGSPSGIGPPGGHPRPQRADGGPR